MISLAFVRIGFQTMELPEVPLGMPFDLQLAFNREMQTHELYLLRRPGQQLLPLEPGIPAGNAFSQAPQARQRHLI